MNSKFVSAMLHTGIVAKQENKTCSLCGHDKPINEYSKNSRSSDGRRWDCKECVESRAKITRINKKKEKDLYASFMPI